MSDTGKHLYQHFSGEEKDFVDKVLEMVERVDRSYVFEVSHFVNPYQAQIIESIAHGAGLQCFSSSLVCPTEMVRVIVAPDYYQLEPEDFGLSLLEIQYNSKFNQLQHHQILGTLLHQLGIERYVLGDILLVSGRAQIFVEANFASFIEINVAKIARVPVQLQSIPLKEMLETQTSVKPKDILVSSLRLDTVIGASFKVSRSEAAKYCNTGKVKVNYRVIEKADYTVTLNDLISVRGLGRFTIQTDNGVSKTGKYKLTVEIISKK